MAASEEEAQGSPDYDPWEEQNELDFEEDGNKAQNKRKRARKKLPRSDPSAAAKRGVCYLSRVPPHMDPSNLRHILSQYGDIQRLYLVPAGSTTQMQRKRTGGFRGKQFSEGWVEFSKKSVAKKVANMLNGEIIGGKRRSSFYYDTWNIKYLSKFQWDDLTNEKANKNHTREQKLAMEISAAKRERDFYLSKVEQSRALNQMQERLKKKRKTDDLRSSGSSPTTQEPKVIRQFRQKRPVADSADQSKPRLSRDVLAAVFGSGS